MTKIMITGSSGLLGCSLVPYLRKHDYDLISHSHNSQIGDVNCDLTNYNEVDEIFRNVNPDVIVNLSALTSVDECETNPNKAYLLNAKIVENLSKWILLNNNCCHLIQISTDHIYDGLGPHTEDQLTLTNYYSFSKYAGEIAASKVFSTILRTNFFGLSECQNRKSFSDWIIDSLLDKREIKVFEDVKFSPLSIHKLVELLRVVIDQRVQGTFNLGSRDGLSKADFAYALAQKFGLSTSNMHRSLSSMHNMKVYRPKDMRMDSSCFEKRFSIVLPTLKEEIKSLKGYVL